MSQRDWSEVEQIFKEKASTIFDTFIHSKEIFLPNTNMLNPFDNSYNNFSAKQLEKNKPGNWIPLYHLNELSDFFIQNNLFPIRAGQAEFFFYKYSIFFNLNQLNFKSISSNQYQNIEDFIPLSLESKVHRNENAYLNKALALGILNHFIGNQDTKVFKTEIRNKKQTRLLYGQFGKIKITNTMNFKTTKGLKMIKEGFQFEIDLVLESKDEIIIFEAKLGNKERDSFSLLQLYYPLIYFRKLTENKKRIRTIFIDIIPSKQEEKYKLVEFTFQDDCFDKIQTNLALSYII